MITGSFCLTAFVIKHSFEDSLCNFEVELRINIASREDLWKLKMVSHNVNESDQAVIITIEHQREIDIFV